MNFGQGLEKAGIFFAFLEKEFRIPKAMEAGRWYHICVNRHEENFQVFVNGKQEYSTKFSVARPMSLNGTLIIGQDQDIRGGQFNVLQSYVGKITGFTFSMSENPIELENIDGCHTHWLDELPLTIDFSNFFWHSYGSISWTDDNPPCGIDKS